jgi:hypothetical protein
VRPPAVWVVGDVVDFHGPAGATDEDDELD